MQKRLVLVVAVCGVTLSCTAPAYAYIDPGSAGLALQAVIGAFAAGLVTLKLYSHRIKSFFFRGSSAKAKAEQREDPPAH